MLFDFMVKCLVHVECDLQIWKNDLKVSVMYMYSQEAEKLKKILQIYHKILLLVNSFHPKRRHNLVLC